MATSFGKVFDYMVDGLKQSLSHIVKRRICSDGKYRKHSTRSLSWRGELEWIWKTISL